MGGESSRARNALARILLDLMTLPPLPFRTSRGRRFALYEIRAQRVRELSTFSTITFFIARKRGRNRRPPNVSLLRLRCDETSPQRPFFPAPSATRYGRHCLFSARVNLLPFRSLLCSSVNARVAIEKFPRS